MISSLWLHLVDVLENYVIYPVEIDQVLVMTNNITTLVYTYAKLRLKKPPENFHKLSHTGRIITCITSSLAWTQ